MVRKKLISIFRFVLSVLVLNLAACKNEHPQHPSYIGKIEMFVQDNCLICDDNETYIELNVYLYGTRSISNINTMFENDYVQSNCKLKKDYFATNNVYEFSQFTLKKKKRSTVKCFKTHISDYELYKLTSSAVIKTNDRLKTIETIYDFCELKTVGFLDLEGNQLFSIEHFILPFPIIM